MSGFSFNLDQKVRFFLSGEEGIITGRAEYTKDENQYRITYKAAHGRQCTGWFSESELLAG